MPTQDIGFQGSRLMCFLKIHLVDIQNAQMMDRDNEDLI